MLGSSPITKTLSGKWPPLLWSGERWTLRTEPIEGGSSTQAWGEGDLKEEGKGPAQRLGNPPEGLSPEPSHARKRGRHGSC